MKEGKKKVSPEFKDHPELGSVFLSADILCLASRDSRLLPVMNTIKIRKQKLTSHRGKIKALSETGFLFSKELSSPDY